MYITIPFLPVLHNDKRLTSQDSQQIVSATFDYIKQSLLYQRYTTLKTLHINVDQQLFVSTVQRRLSMVYCLMIYHEDYW